jgi:hypothetical protein
LGDRIVYKAKAQYEDTNCTSGDTMSSMYFKLSESESDRGYIVVDVKNKNNFLKPGDRVRVSINDGLVIVFRKIGGDERYSMPWKIAQDVIIRKA